MPKYTPQQLKEIERKLPEDVRDALYSVETTETIQDIGKRYRLHIDQVSDLADVVGHVMTGFTHPRDFRGAVQKRLRLDDETARQVVGETDTRIFGPIRKSLRGVHSNTQARRQESTPSTSPVATQVDGKEARASSPRASAQQSHSAQQDAYREPVERESRAPAGKDAPVKKEEQARQTPAHPGQKPAPKKSESRTENTGGSLAKAESAMKFEEGSATPSREMLLKEIEEAGEHPKSAEKSGGLVEKQLESTPSTPKKGSTQTNPPVAPTETTQARAKRKETYNEGDPYREPIN